MYEYRESDTLLKIVRRNHGHQIKLGAHVQAIHAQTNERGEERTWRVRVAPMGLTEKGRQRRGDSSIWWVFPDEVEIIDE